MQRFGLSQLGEIFSVLTLFFPSVGKGWFYDCNKTGDCSITAYLISMFMTKTKQIGKFFLSMSVKKQCK